MYEEREQGFICKENSGFQHLFSAIFGLSTPQNCCKHEIWKWELVKLTWTCQWGKIYFKRLKAKAWKRRCHSLQTAEAIVLVNENQILFQWILPKQRHRSALSIYLITLPNINWTHIKVPELVLRVLLIVTSFNHLFILTNTHAAFALSGNILGALKALAYLISQRSWEGDAIIVLHFRWRSEAGAV